MTLSRKKFNTSISNWTSLIIYVLSVLQIIQRKSINFFRFAGALTCKVKLQSQLKKYFISHSRCSSSISTKAPLLNSKQTLIESSKKKRVEGGRENPSFHQLFKFSLNFIHLLICEQFLWQFPPLANKICKAAASGSSLSRISVFILQRLSPRCYSISCFFFYTHPSQEINVEEG